MNTKRNMYKVILSAILLVALVLAIQPGAYAKTVPYQERFDINSITGKRTYVSSVSRGVSNNAYWYSTSTNKVSSGWNYNRYVSVLTYYDSSTKKYYR
ncbi:hypothetical protein PWEIH_15683 [Listeria weihenstephanensis FSL R9-0317]|uniref:Bacteriocin n=1 Tax=Listeria weihenstephanensis TaxID=1006155 RepID=A0A1S7FXX9_9LIST|nr:hypothetical protein [Listeria weihenstephanensis]AQY52260.1 hypothetical protein UE46_15360 [Listeria weihenstephanensis]EUJ35375.1 hypothetical protein PWEIH_15683 [Listeria weihenstephanensis FSL R9-0317]